MCPIDYDEVKGGLSMECERSFAFRLHEYSVPWFMHGIGALVRFSVSATVAQIVLILYNMCRKMQ